MKGFNLSTGSSSTAGAAAAAGATTAAVAGIMANTAGAAAGAAPGTNGGGTNGASAAGGPIKRSSLTTAEVNAAGAGVTCTEVTKNKSPITKLARLAKLAGSAKDGIIAAGTGGGGGAETPLGGGSSIGGGSRTPSLKARTGARSFLHRLGAGGSGGSGGQSTSDEVKIYEENNTMHKTPI